MGTKKPSKPTFRVLAEFVDQAITDKRVLAKIARQMKSSGKVVPRKKRKD